MLGAVVSIVASGLLIGWLARWGVPGPDPMPLWLTFLFGLGGSMVGGVTAALALGGTKDVSSSDYFTIVLAEILASQVSADEALDAFVARRQPRAQWVRERTHHQIQLLNAGAPHEHLAQGMRETYARLADEI